MARASEVAYATLRADILELALAPGEPLAEVDLSLRLGISRTPVREALARLVADGLAEPVGGRGLVVSPLSLDNVRELFELRQALEQQAASLAAQRRDVRVFEALREQLAGVDTSDLAGYYEVVARFDAAVDAAVGNPYLVAALGSVRTHLSRIRRLSRDKPARLADAAREHLHIVAAIIDGDPRLAASATSVHLDRSLRSIMESAAETTADITRDTAHHSAERTVRTPA
jgi:GntR family transcriptional regulator, rspAB operon transcriptional repressor